MQTHRTYQAALGLAWLSQYGCHSLLKMLDEKGPLAVWTASRADLRAWGILTRAAAGFEQKKKLFDAEQAEALVEKAGARFIPFGAADYPDELKHLALPPAGLFVVGARDAWERLLAMPRVTVVGTRKASAYGVQATEAFAAAFASNGVAVISGMAMGIDGRAHRAALEAGGLTAAVLGCGPDIAYPPRSRWLHGRLKEVGLVLSELPPGTSPARWTFPHRNRILAALGDAVVVVEAPRASGALQTVTQALELGRPVFSVPGSIYAETQKGCNLLLYDGAGPALEPCVTVQDFFSQTRIQRGKRQPRGDLHPAAEHEERQNTGTHDRAQHRGMIMMVLASGPSTVDGLIDRTGLGVRESITALAELELEGLVRRSGPGMYARAP